MLQVTIPTSNTCIYPESMRLTPNGSPTCIVKNLFKYIQRRPWLTANHPLFPNITRNTMQKILRLLATAAGIPETVFVGNHSMRRGGATQLCAGAHVATYAIRKHGRWNSDIWQYVYQALEDETAMELSLQLAPATTTTTSSPATLGHNRNKKKKRRDSTTRRVTLDEEVHHGDFDRTTRNGRRSTIPNKFSIYQMNQPKRA